MRKIKLTTCLLLAVLWLKGQDLPKVIPPSPEATSMIQYGNTSVNFYAGQPSLSIPIHTVSIRGYQLPVSLSYTSFQGINVEGIAPWVGLGWALNATGTVSRTVKDLPDDIISSKGSGYMSLSEPDLNDPVEMAGYLNGDKDKEPDKFNYSVNGVSGSFFIDRGGAVIQKSKSDVIINYYKSAEIDSFRIIDTRGYTYDFTEVEKTLNLGPGQVAVDVPVSASSWYLSSVKDQNGLELISFTYHDLADLKHTTSSAQVNKDDLQVFLANSDMRYSRNTTTAKRIKEISYSGGKVKFIKSDDSRQDYTNDKYLKEIQVLDGLDNIIRRYKLSYSYFDENGGSAIDSPVRNLTFNNMSVGDYYKRLKLEQIQEWNQDETLSIPPYKFDYYGGNLPHRYSFATDHWGFYNGQESNNSPEPYYKLGYYVISNNSQPQEVLRTLGTANKDASATHTKYAVLRKVTYPTGGSTTFELEGNTAESDDLPNDKSNQTFDLNVDNVQSNNFSVNLLADPFTFLRVRGSIPHQACGINGAVYDANTNTELQVFTMPFNGNGGPSTHDYSIKLKGGTYYLKLNYQSGCTYNDSRDKLSVSFDNELATTNKPVGGLRVESITDHDGISDTNDITRYFYYQENGKTGNSTGRLVSIPQYAYQRMEFVYFNGAWSTTPHPFGIIRSIKSLFPLMTTNGSYVGYGKVTIINGDEQVTGKTEYEFTTAAEFPDFKDGYYNSALSGDNFFNSSLGLQEIYPFAETEDRDYMRGLQKRQTVYKYNGSSFDKVSEVINDYVLTYNVPTDNGSSLNPGAFPDASANGTNYSYLKGLKLHITGPGAFDFKWYNLYTGRLDLRTTTSRQFSAESPANFLETVTTNFWDDLADDHYQISRTQNIDSEGVLHESKMYYPYNLNSVSPLFSTPEINAISEMIKDTTNLVSSVIQQEQFKAGNKLSAMRNNFLLSNGYVLPSSVETAKGDNNLETRVVYHLYDEFGNPLEVSQEDGTRITYVWGYDKTLPVAKLQNATFSQVELVLGSGFDLGSNGLSQTQANSLRNISGALVTTIEYQWGLGMISQTDSNGLETTYEYDSFGRLKLVKDPDGNIINTYKYNYKGQ